MEKDLKLFIFLNVVCYWLLFIIYYINGLLSDSLVTIYIAIPIILVINFNPLKKCEQLRKYFKVDATLKILAFLIQNLIAKLFYIEKGIIFFYIFNIILIMLVILNIIFLLYIYYKFYINYTNKILWQTCIMMFVYIGTIIFILKYKVQISSIIRSETIMILLNIFQLGITFVGLICYLIYLTKITKKSKNYVFNFYQEFMNKINLEDEELEKFVFNYFNTTIDLNYLHEGKPLIYYVINNQKTKTLKLFIKLGANISGYEQEILSLTNEIYLKTNRYVDDFCDFFADMVF